MYDRRNGRPRQILVSLFCLLALGYFAYHAIVGKRGLEARARLIERSRELGPQIKRLETVRFRLERDVRLLDAADPDIVEELAIELLGFVRPGDRVVLFNGQPRTTGAGQLPPGR
jgi:cell division protein FtsB